MESCFWYDGVMKYIQVWLSCVDKVEANKIAKVLLEKRLIACAKKLPINSTFHWQNKIESNDEAMLLMDSREDLFEDIEAEVTKLHSYETFVLQAVPVIKISQKSQSWLKSVMK